jgi:hypothetical protein
MRFGIGGDRPYTLTEISKHLQISRERVRQIKAKALRKLKHPSRVRYFEKILSEKKPLKNPKVYKWLEDLGLSFLI